MSGTPEPPMIIETILAQASERMDQRGYPPAHTGQAYGFTCACSRCKPWPGHATQKT